MSAIDKLTAELNAEKQKLALYEKNLRVAVESCKVLKAEKENLANIVAGFACSEIKADASDVEKLKQQIALLIKEFQSKESALVLARTTVLKENSELKKRLAEAESFPKTGLKKNESAFHMAELEQQLRKEVALNRKYEKKLQQLEESLKQNNASDNKFEKANKKLEDEKEQFKKLYEEAHGKSIYLERKFASLQLDQKMVEQEASKTVFKEPVKPEDDYRISNLESQLINVSKQCDQKENEISELSSLITLLKGENISLKEKLDVVDKCRSTTPLAENNFSDFMAEQYEIFKQENQNPLDFCCPSLQNDIALLIEKAERNVFHPDETKIHQNKILELEHTIKKLNLKIHENDHIQLQNEKKIEKLEDELKKGNEEIKNNKEEISVLKEKLNQEQLNKNELEQEVMKQRTRAQDEIHMRDREIEVFKKMLVTMRNEKMEKHSGGRKLSRHNRTSTFEDENESRRSRTFSDDDNAAVPNDPDSKNVYYENQLTKKECDIQELRKQLMDLEIRLRENEAVSMTRQLESIASSEELIEKVRMLEGKLQMLSSTNEIDYLRNIFSQFLHSMNSPNQPSRLILKAMASVLKVPISDIKLIEKK